MCIITLASTTICSMEIVEIMKIYGLQKLTLLDFPEHTACTVFTSGCNMRCPFCHNASLVEGVGEELDYGELMAFLKKRQGLLDGVAITGGEPLLQADIADFVKELRSMGYAVKLDTNGSLPYRLKPLLDEGLLDYVAMDIKNSPEQYEKATGCFSDFSKIAESMELLRESNTPFEFRTTVVKGIHTEESLKGIAAILQKGDRWFLQQYVDSGDILGGGTDAFSPEEMRVFCTADSKIFPAFSLRGL